ncbi:hypothetical protein EGR_10510 [Echinococcus granulosus]|uniref:Transducer of regulated CREB activity N-terminal domain-containing protein n=1 Tax=Echinococcus granulosus TaxID=6210 RepID=W6U8A3_ECHGR|nr:hypothetical protein EGR_10510 [Echinococcus granulosus]EUB54637.1 hypothetical protein EGR_10510 [Echinococcus granulosus]
MTGKPHNNTNPRKFKEKIELLRQKEAQLTANFMEVMRGIPTLTRNVVPYPDLPNKELLQPDSYSPTLRPPLDSTKSSGYTRRRDNSGNYQYTLETSTGTSNRGLYNNGRGGGGGGGGGVSQTPRMDGVESQSQQRLPPPPQSQSRGVEAKMATAGLLQTSAESGKPGLLSHISPLHASQTSPFPSAYQPNLVPISVSPHSSQFYTSSNTSPSRQHHLQFQQPPLLPPPPPSLGLAGAASQQPLREYTCQSAWGHPGNQDCGNGPVGNALNSASTAASMIGEMSLVEYRRTYSDSCIPNSFPDVSDHSRCFPPHQQYNRQQHQQPPPPPLLPLPLQRQQQRQQQRTLPPVDELALPRYQNTNSNTASNRPHTSCFNGGLLSSRCRHQSSTTVSQQPFRRLQSDYHSMRNIPQRYAPVHHHHHNPQQAATPVQPLLVQTAGGGEGYASGPIAHPYQTWNTNGGNGGGSISAYDLPSSSSALRLKRSDVYSEYRAKPPPLQLLPHVSQMPTTMGYKNHSVRSVGSSCSSDGGGGGYFSASTADPLAYHQPQSSCASSVLGSAAAATAANNNGVGSIAISSSAPLTQPLDISVLDSDAFHGGGGMSHEIWKVSRSTASDLLDVAGGFMLLFTLPSYELEIPAFPRLGCIHLVAQRSK